MADFWSAQEQLESKLNWNAKGRIREAEDKELARIEELNFSLYRALEEGIKMYYEAAVIDSKRYEEGRVDRDNYDRLGYEATDTLIFLKKAGDALEQGLTNYLREERSERYGGEKAVELLSDLLSPNSVEDVETEEERLKQLKSKAEDVIAQLGPQPRDTDTGFIKRASVDQLLEDNLYKQFLDVMRTEDISQNEDLGRYMATTMLAVVETMAYLPRDASDYLEEKQARLRARIEAGEDFGEGNLGYGQAPDWMVKGPEQASDPLWINLLAETS